MDFMDKAIKYYEWTNTLADPRLKSWPFIDSPFHTILIVFIYLLIILNYGPKLMKNRDPFDFGYFLPAYNFSLVALNYYILHLTFIGSYQAGYSYTCTPVTKELENPHENKVMLGVYLYYISKLIELLDTVLFLLTKRFRQITFLHVYHHSTMPLIWWIGAKWFPGGQAFFGVMLNSFVHVIMYTYYGLSSCGPSMKKYLWWKKYITVVQLVQFCLAIIHTTNSLYVECPIPKWTHWALILYAMSFVFLFTNFYVQTYNKSLNKPKKSTDDYPVHQTKTARLTHSAVRRRKIKE